MNTTTTVDREARAAQRLLHFIHMIRGRNICGICDLHFVTRVDLNEHMQQHVGISYTCDCCKVICNTWLGFQEHWLIHRHMVFCPYCYKVHTNYWRLNLHWRMHEPYECDLCYDTFKTLSDLRNHHFSLHREIPFNLPFCPLPVEREE